MPGIDPTPLPPASNSDRRLPVTIVGGVAPRLRAAVVATALQSPESVVVVDHDLSDLRLKNLVRRKVIDISGVIEEETIELEHGCVSCTLREDVLPTIARLADLGRWSALLLMLPDVIEPDGVVAALSECMVGSQEMSEVVRVDSVVVVVDARTFIPDLDTTDDLSDRGIAAAEEDNRTVAEVVARQVEAADIVLIGGAVGEDPLDVARVGTMIEHLNPLAAQVAIADLMPTNLVKTRRHDPITYFQRWEPGVLRPSACSCVCGVSTLVWRARRPFHSERLHDNLSELVGPILRGRGHIWLATRPRTMLSWETAGGGLALTPASAWLAGAPEPAWSQITPLRRTVATMAWDPYYGDREQALAFIGIDLDHEGIQATLEHCLLTDDELCEGETAWRQLSDPFSAFLDDEDDFLATLSPYMAG